MVLGFDFLQQQNGKLLFVEAEIFADFLVSAASLSFLCPAFPVKSCTFFSQRSVTIGSDSKEFSALQATTKEREQLFQRRKFCSAIFIGVSVCSVISHTSRFSYCRLRSEAIET